MAKRIKFPALGLKVKVPSDISVKFNTALVEGEGKLGTTYVTEYPGGRKEIETGYANTGNKNKNLYVRIHEEIHVLEEIRGKRYLEKAGREPLKKAMDEASGYLKAVIKRVKASKIRKRGKASKIKLDRVDLLTFLFFVMKTRNKLGTEKAMQIGALNALSQRCGGTTILPSYANLGDYVRGSFRDYGPKLSSDNEYKRLEDYFKGDLVGDGSRYLKERPLSKGFKTSYF